MKRIIPTLAGLTVIAAIALYPSAAMAGTGGECVAGAERYARQQTLANAFGCRIAPVPGPDAPVDAQRFCLGNQPRFMHLVAVRAEALEKCLLTRLGQTDDPQRPEVSEWSQRMPAAAPGSGPYPDAARDGNAVVLRPAGTEARGAASALPDGAGESETGRAESARRIRELLAQAPPAGAIGRPGTARATRALRAGLVWSFGGKIEGMHCLHWNEPSDPHDWYDNYLCSERDAGFRWSYRGPIQGRGLRCIQVHEPSDPDMWHDNYFCWPRDLRVIFRFSAAGRIAGMDCIAIVEPSDPHTWGDNYLCYREDRVPE
jgi:hypothetical protein